MATTSTAASLQQTILRRVLASGDARRLHVRFSAAVLDRYRAMPNAELIRTRTVGRVGLPRQWSLDVGIVEDGPDGVVLHATVEDLLTRLPEAERDHWIAHLLGEAPNVSASMNSLSAQLSLRSVFFLHGFPMRQGG